MRSDRIRVCEPSEQVYIHPGDKVDARNGEPLQTVVICRENADAGLRRARQVDRVSRGNAVISPNPGILVRRLRVAISNASRLYNPVSTSPSVKALVHSVSRRASMRS